MKKKTVRRKQVAKLDLPWSSICAACAKKKGAVGIPGHACTRWTGTCPYCKKQKGLTGTNDYLWPDTGQPRGMWD